MYLNAENKTVRYSVVVPLYNEEKVINMCWQEITRVMNTLNENYEIIFVNDGSQDNTLLLAGKIIDNDSHTKLINFSRNFGHQAAISAGMNYANGLAIVVIDADLQDPPDVIPEMIAQWKQGYHVVYGRRIKRNGDSLFKKLTALLFYRFLDKMTDVNLPLDAGDFRLIDHKVRDELKKLPEKNRYVRGLVSWLGFKQTSVPFVREKRYAGKSKYPIQKMLKFALDGLTSFSYKPLKLATFSGILLSLFSFSYLLFVVWQKIFTSTTIRGWASTVAINLFFNGFILIILGIIGEYIGRIYDEVKMRPLYVVENTVGFERESVEK